MIRSAALRSCWCSRSVSVWAGATTMESPVWTPIGSRFSMLQTVMQVPVASRITSYSSSLQPTSERSTSTWPIGEAARPAATVSVYCASLSQMPPPVPPRVKAGRTTRGRPIRSRAARRLRLRGDRGRLGDGLADADEQLLEELAVLGGADRLERGAEHPHVVALEHAGVGERDGEVEPGLAAEGAEQPVGPLLLDDPLEHADGEGLDVDRVGAVVVGHDRRRVAVHQHHPDPLLAERPAGLGPGVVELRGLADDDRPAPHHEHAAGPLGLRHGSSGHHRRPGRSCRHRQELVEHRAAVLGSGSALGVILHRERGERGVAQPLDAAVVEVALADEPARALGKGVAVDLELVVLGGDEDPAADAVVDGVVAPVVSEGEPRRGGTDRAPEDLVAEADAEHRDPALEQRGAEPHRPGEHRRVAGTVGEQDPVGPVAKDVVDAGVGADHDHLGATAAQRPQAVALHPVVDGDDPQPGVGTHPHPSGDAQGALQGRVERLLPAHPQLAEGDRADEVLVAHVGRGAGARHLLLRARRRRREEDAAHRPAVAEVEGERAGVDPHEPGDAVPAQLLVEAALAARVADLRGELAHHHRPRPHPRGLGVLVAAAVVADERMGHHHHLAGVGRVGGDLLVAGHAGVEDDLAAHPRGHVRAEEPPLEAPPRLQGEPSPLSHPASAIRSSPPPEAAARARRGRRRRRRR